MQIDGINLGPQDRFFCFYWMVLYRYLTNGLQDSALLFIQVNLKTNMSYFNTSACAKSIESDKINKKLEMEKDIWSTKCVQWGVKWDLYSPPNLSVASITCFLASVGQHQEEVNDLASKNSHVKQVDKSNHKSCFIHMWINEQIHSRTQENEKNKNWTSPNSHVSTLSSQIKQI